MPIVSVTPLGSAPDGIGSAIGQIIDYLERGSRRPQPNASIVGYYADTPTTAGVWRGRGVDGYQLTGPVHTETFRTVLEGNHPLLTSEGRDHARPVAAIDRLDHLQAATAGVTVRDLAGRISAAERRMPIDERELRDLTEQLDRHIARAVAKPADYVISLLEPRPSEDHDSDLSPERWDTAATAIETHRHRTGISPFDGPLKGDTPFESAVGTITDPIDALTIGRAIDAHLDGPTTLSATAADELDETALWSAATKNRVAATKKSLRGNLYGNQCGNVAAAT